MGLRSYRPPVEFLEPRRLLAAIYTLTDLGSLPGASFSEAHAINNNGLVVGDSGPDGFIWDSARGMRPLPQLPGVVSSSTQAINSSGEIVGQAFGTHGENDSHAVLWPNEIQVIDLADGGEGTTASAINDSGEVAGAINARAFRWTAGSGVERIGDDPSFANSINSSGEIVGSNPTGYVHAVLWSSDGSVVTLFPDSPPGGSATAISSDGWVVGRASSPLFGDSAQHAFVWSPSNSVQRVNSFSGIFSNLIPVGINAAHTVIGEAGTTNPETSSDPAHAFIWDPQSGTHDLNSLLDSSGAGWKIMSATAINDFGEIVGYGISPAGQGRAVLLTPMSLERPIAAEPEPLVLSSLPPPAPGRTGLVLITRTTE